MDPNSLASLDTFTTKHLHLDWNVDFERRVLSGSVQLHLETRDVNVPGARPPPPRLQLDTNQLTISEVSWRIDANMPWATLAKDAAWKLHEERAPFGRALEISVPQDVMVKGKVTVQIRYETAPTSTAVQWLAPSQTVTKAHPYLFTQCQAIHARSMVPCQDSPAVKCTYTAKVTVPAPLRAVMSATQQAEPQANPDQGTISYFFEQKMGVPSYLLALAVGALKGIEIGPRTTVWSEEGMVEKGAWEFEETEKFLATAEQLITPYCWGRYDLLLLPPSFPYGGMENPCLTFVTPTLLAGDRSLVDVVAHEISHSWAGNLVTNANWQHFWLNEGFCVFIERKILGRLYGEDARQFSAILGWKALRESVELFGADNPLTSLTPDLKGIDPDDAFSSVPYEKGFNFLYYLEQLLGGPDVFEPYVKAYYTHFANQSITTDDWKAFLYEYMAKHHPENLAKLDSVDWVTWLQKPGMPPVAMPFDQKLANACTQLAKRWDAARASSIESLRSQFPVSEFAAFTAGQKIVFLEKLGDCTVHLPHALLADMATVYRPLLAESENSEIRFRWQQLCLQASYEPVFPAVVRFITEQGRMKYVRPLYRALYHCGTKGKELAQQTFRQHRALYHPIAAQMIAKDLQMSSSM